MIKVGYSTNIGIKRKKNEDAYYIIEDQKVYMVADGVGGNNSGEVASKTSVEFISKNLVENPIKGSWDESKIKDYFMDAIIKANLNLLEKAGAADINQGMATTLVLVYLFNEKCLIFNIGDSRAYSFHQGKLSQITEDHSFVNTLVKTGTITKEEGRLHPKKNIITRALGAEPKIEIDFFSINLEAGDLVILSTDGLHGEVGDNTIEDIVKEEKDMQRLCDRLVSIANLQGGGDNITVICLEYEGGI
ncbi:MAG: Stp1/IreP family PP2C-type Ser/Thr phosphatase [Peptostreptococcaceae bacterium]|nr:Stp1/IreP family PP2C-type Ser/Thr phosphatase [Peptostreptococcaceae bacterium]